MLLQGVCLLQRSRGLCRNSFSSLEHGSCAVHPGKFSRAVSWPPCVRKPGQSHLLEAGVERSSLTVGMNVGISLFTDPSVGLLLEKPEELALLSPPPSLRAGGCEIIRLIFESKVRSTVLQD